MPLGGIEPPRRKATTFKIVMFYQFHHKGIRYGRSRWIRTTDLSRIRRVLYQTELSIEINIPYILMTPRHPIHPTTNLNGLTCARVNLMASDVSECKICLYSRWGSNPHWLSRYALNVLCLPNCTTGIFGLGQDSHLHPPTHQPELYKVIITVIGRTSFPCSYLSYQATKNVFN